MPVYQRFPARLTATFRTGAGNAEYDRERAGVAAASDGSLGTF